MKVHCKGLPPSETKYEIMTFCWKMEEEEAVVIQFLNFQNNFRYFISEKDVVLFHFLFIFSHLFQGGQMAELVSGASGLPRS